MLVILIGLVLMGYCVCACLPQVLGWGPEIIASLKGVTPVIAALSGIVLFSIGYADIRDKKEARREEQEAEKARREAQGEDNK